MSNAFYLFGTVILLALERTAGFEHEDGNRYTELVPAKAVEASTESIIGWKRSVARSYDLQDNSQLYWLTPDDSSETIAVSLDMRAQPNETILDLERFDDEVEIVSCTDHDEVVDEREPMTLRFRDPDDYQTAFAAWDWVNKADERSFILIESSNECGTPGRRRTWRVQSMGEGSHGLTMNLKIEPQSWKDSLKDYELKWGEQIPVPLQRRWDFGLPDVGKSFGFDFSVAHPFPTQIFSETAGKVGMDLVCNECGTQGSLSFSGEVRGTITGLTKASATIRPKGISAAVNLGMKLSADSSALGFPAFSKHWTLATIPVPNAGFSIPHILTLGPNIQINAGFELNQIRAAAMISSGVTATIPDSSVASIDLMSKKQLDVSGWKPTFDFKPLTVSAELEAQAEFFIEAAAAISLLILDDTGFNVDVALRVPDIIVEARTVTNSNGVCPDSKAKFGVTVDASVGAALVLEGYTELDGNEKPFLDLDLFRVPKSLTLPQGCTGLDSGIPDTDPKKKDKTPPKDKSKEEKPKEEKPKEEKPKEEKPKEEKPKEDDPPKKEKPKDDPPKEKTPPKQATDEKPPKKETSPKDGDEKPPTDKDKKPPPKATPPTDVKPSKASKDPDSSSKTDLPSTDKKKGAGAADEPEKANPPSNKDSPKPPKGANSTEPTKPTNATDPDLGTTASPRPSSYPRACQYLQEEAIDDINRNSRKRKNGKSGSASSPPRPAAPQKRSSLEGSPYLLACDSKDEMPLQPWSYRRPKDAAAKIPIFKLKVECDDEAVCPPKLWDVQISRDKKLVQKAGHGYASEHVYERVWVRDFLDYLYDKYFEPNPSPADGVKGSTCKGMVEAFKLGQNTQSDEIKAAKNYAEAIMQKMGTLRNYEKTMVIFPQAENQQKNLMFEQEGIATAIDAIGATANKRACGIGRVATICKYLEHTETQVRLNNTIVGVDKILALMDADDEVKAITPKALQDKTYVVAHHEFLTELWTNAYAFARKRLKEYSQNLLRDKKSEINGNNFDASLRTRLKSFSKGNMGQFCTRQWHF